MKGEAVGSDAITQVRQCQGGARLGTKGFTDGWMAAIGGKFRALPLVRTLLVIAAITLPDMVEKICGVRLAHAADEVTADEIAKALRQTKRPTDGQNAVQEVEDLKRIRMTRDWNQEERSRLAQASANLGQIDLTIFFAFDSADIEVEAESALSMLGEALARPEYDGATFVIAGHTDAKGTAEYNQGLSERRAEAVKRYIVARFNISVDELLTVGYGFEQLKDTTNPYSGVNRRVQVINITD